MGEPIGLAFQSLHHGNFGASAAVFADAASSQISFSRGFSFMSLDFCLLGLSSKPMNETYLLPSSFINIAILES